MPNLHQSYESPESVTITLRDYARPIRERHKGSCGPYQWCPTSAGTGRGYYASRDDGTPDRTGAGFDLRPVRTFDPITWWYGGGETTDPFYPVVLRLPRSRGFLAGWTMGKGMCATIEPDIYETEEEAIRAAEHEANRMAEQEADERAADDAAWDAGRKDGERGDASRSEEYRECDHQERYEEGFEHGREILAERAAKAITSPPKRN